MPGVDLLGWAKGGITVKLHTSATDLLIGAYPTLCQQEISATIILAHALERSRAEGEQLRALREGCQERDWVETLSLNTPIVDDLSARREFWLTVWASSGSGRPTTNLRIVVSCLSWCLGDYPIFIWSSDEPGAVSEAELEMVQTALLSIVHPKRVFSVFGRSDLVVAFSDSWTSKTAFKREVDPFYRAILTYCTEKTLKLPRGPPPAGDATRKANLSDLGPVAVLCKEFADTSIFFPLTQNQGKEEAEWLIKRRVLWLYETAGKVVSICAVARESEKVAVVTKVYTTPTWRRNGFAERLVRKVTKDLLSEKQVVALYVGTRNDAQHVYDKVGYVGLSETNRPLSLENVLEIGFSGTDRGHW